MHGLKTIRKVLAAHLDLRFAFKFVFFFAGLYSFNLFYIAITDPRGQLYSPFLVRHLDYISWLRTSILYTAKLVSHGLGVHGYVADAYTLRVPHGPGVIIGLTCVGYGVMSFWIAFVLAHNGGWRKKLWWGLGGVAAFWCINCLRIALLLAALAKHRNVNHYLDHHDLFTAAVYTLILVMIYRYYKTEEKERPRSSSKRHYTARA